MTLPGVHVTENDLKQIEDERHHSPTFVTSVRVPELIAEVRRLRAEVAKLECALDSVLNPICE